MNRLLIGCLLLAMHAQQPFGWAGTGGSVTLPIPGVIYKTTSGLQLNLVSHWVQSSGYRPVEATITSLRANVADRHLHVSITPLDWSDRRHSVEFDITVPEGTTRVTREIAVPQNSVWNRLQIAVYEDGRRLDDLSARNAGNLSPSSWTWTEAYPSTLFIDFDAPDPQQASAMIAGSAANNQFDLPDIFAVAELMAPVDDFSQNIRLSAQKKSRTTQEPAWRDDAQILSAVPKLPTLALLPPNRLPVQAINYSCIDLIFVSLTDVERMAAEYPEPLSAIREYVVRGGNLIVSGVGANGSGLRSIEEHLTIPTEASSESSTDAWTTPARSLFGPRLEHLASPNGVAQTYRKGQAAIYEAVEPEADEMRMSLTKSAPKCLFRWREFGWGCLIALESDSLGQADSRQWAWVLDDVGSDRWKWYRRHGISLVRPNSEFWDFLIPGVGAAPVRVFLGVITAFMLIIGPVNYFLLNRSRRLYLLLITVPLGSVLMIVALFGYALVKDGLATRTRLRSFTEILPDGQAVTWSRQSYYAGLAPSSGFIYPTTAAVYPIEFDPGRVINARLTLKWRDVQQLAPGYLKSRTTSQQLVVSSRKIEPSITIVRDESTAPEVTNDGLDRTNQILIYDGNETFWIEDLRPGATASAVPLSPAEARDRYGRLVRANRPAKPIGFTAPRERGRYRYNVSNFENGFGTPDFQYNLMEGRMIAPILQSPRADRAYYCVTERAPDFVPVGVEHSLQKAGFHVVYGTW